MLKEVEVPDRNRNAKVIIPLVIGVWLLGILVFQTGAPPAFGAIFGIARCPSPAPGKLARRHRWRW
jgi:hypothetical protein